MFAGINLELAGLLQNFSKNFGVRFIGSMQGASLFLPSVGIVHVSLAVVCRCTCCVCNCLLNTIPVLLDNL